MKTNLSKLMIVVGLVMVFSFLVFRMGSEYTILLTAVLGLIPIALKFADKESKEKAEKNK